MPPPPAPRGLTACRPCIYHTRTMSRYNTETNTWEQLPSLKAGITSAAVVAHDGFLYVAGERGGRDSVGWDVEDVVWY